MTTIVCQYPLDNSQKALLCNEFPRCRFIFTQSEASEQLLGSHLKLVEIFFGGSLTAEQIEEAPLLRWIHAPKPDLRGLPIRELRGREDVIVTATEPENVAHSGEFMIGAVLSCAKHLCEWHGLQGAGDSVWESPLVDEVLSLENKIFVQVGLGTLGTEMVRRAKQFNMRVRGVHHNRTYHPHCDRILTEQELHSVLPAADVVSVALPYAWRYHHAFGREELALMKDQSILVVSGAGGVVDEVALAEMAAKGKFRGVVMDAVEDPPLTKASPLLQCPQVLVTPGIAGCPRTPPTLAYRTFRRNLRHFIPGNYIDMDGAVNLSLWQ